jgi:hypothetical protein
MVVCLGWDPTIGTDGGIMAYYLDEWYIRPGTPCVDYPDYFIYTTYITTAGVKCFIAYSNRPEMVIRRVGDAQTAERVLFGALPM